MKRVLLLFSLTLPFLPGFAQTMDFSGGASYSGYSFSNWSSCCGVIYLNNLANPATISKSSGTWSVISFDTTPFGAGGNFQATSNLGHSYTFNPGTGARTHTLNWIGITTLTITRTNPAAGSFDFDNVVFSTSLPVEFLSLDARRFGNGALITWEVEESGEIAGYEIQRKSTEQTDFETVGQVGPQSGKTGPLTYSFTDTDLLTGSAYYRIRQSDMNGDVTLSPVVVLSTQPTRSFEAWGENGTLHIRGISGVLTVMDLSGRSCLQAEVKETGTDLPATGLPTGVYLLSVRDEQGISRQRKIILTE